MASIETQAKAYIYGQTSTNVFVSNHTYKIWFPMNTQDPHLSFTHVFRHKDRCVACSVLKLASSCEKAVVSEFPH